MDKYIDEEVEQVHSKDIDKQKDAVKHGKHYAHHHKRELTKETALAM